MYRYWPNLPGKKWRLFILPQCHASFTRPISTRKTGAIFCKNVPCANDIVSPRFESFLWVVKVFVRYELWVNVPLAIFFLQRIKRNSRIRRLFRPWIRQLVYDLGVQTCLYVSRVFFSFICFLFHILSLVIVIVGLTYH